MRTAALLASALALCLAALAGAQAGDGAVTDDDDSKSRVDIASVRAVHDQADDRLLHFVRFHEPISPRNFRNAVDPDGPPGSVCVNIWTSRTPWEAPPNFDVCVSGDRDRKKLVASVSRHRAGGAVRRVGRANAELTSSRRMVIRFDPDLIRRPRAYRWSTHAATFERGCTRRGCHDYAPRPGRAVRTRLAPPRG